jgi:hypothetical protein
MKDSISLNVHESNDYSRPIRTSKENVREKIMQKGLNGFLTHKSSAK